MSYFELGAIAVDVLTVALSVSIALRIRRETRAFWEDVRQMEREKRDARARMRWE